MRRNLLAKYINNDYENQSKKIKYDANGNPIANQPNSRMSRLSLAISNKSISTITGAIASAKSSFVDDSNKDGSTLSHSQANKLGSKTNVNDLSSSSASSSSSSSFNLKDIEDQDERDQKRYKIQCELNAQGASDLVVDLFMSDLSSKVFKENVLLAIALLEGGNTIVQVDLFFSC